MICKICVKHTSLFILGTFFWGFIENSVNFFRGAHEKPIYRRGEGRGGGEKGEAGRGGGLITECILCSHQRLVFYFAINFGMP